MKNKLLLTACLLYLFNIASQAAPVTPNVAKQQAAIFLTQLSANSRQTTSRVASMQRMLTLAYTGMSASEEADYYVFNKNQSAGYIIISGDDRMPAVLGYSDSGTFNYNKIPYNMRAFLGEYAREAEYLRSHPTVENNTTTDTYATAVEPLLKNITWNQTKPYNNSCPSDYPTGCVATAMGQVMYYYRYPEHGIGSKTYQWNGQQLTANFGTTTYQWNNMQDKLTVNSPAAAQSAVATLLYHVGVSVNMNYGPASEGGSGASPSYIAPALVRYFGYDKGCNLRSREYFTKTEWEATVRNELDNGRPILYGGYTVSASGHSFVCDGYNQQGYYHINWCWDGLNNGYFLLSALDPKTKGTGGGAEGQGYNYNQTMVIGIQKPVEGSKQAYSFVFKYVDPATVTVNRNEAATLKAYGAHTDGIDPLNVRLRFEVLNINGKRIATSAVSSQYIPTGETVNYEGALTLPDSISDGTYEARLAGNIVGIDGDNEYNLLHYLIGENGYYKVLVKDGKVTYTPAGLPSLGLQSLSVEPNPIVSKKRFTVSATIQNNGGEFDGKLAYSLEHPDGVKKSYYSPDKAVNIKAGETAVVTFTDSVELYGNDNYTLQLVRRDGIQHVNLGAPITVKVIGEKEKANLVGVDYMDIATGADNAKRDHLDVSAFLLNKGGDFEGKLTCLIFKDENTSGTPLASLDTVEVNIGKDEYKTVNITGKFLAGKDKQTYYACLYNVDEDNFMSPTKYTGLKFTIRDDASNEQPRLYLKKQISFGDEPTLTADNLKVYATIQNTGGTYTGTVEANFFNVNGWTPLATLTKQATIGYGETAVVELTGASDKLKEGKTYDVGITYDGNEETAWMSYALHASYSNAQVTIASPTAITLPEQDGQARAEIYSIAGNLMGHSTVAQLNNKLSSLPHGQYIIRYSNGTQTVVRHIVK